MPSVSAGLLIYRRRGDAASGERLLEVLLVRLGGARPGGKHAGSWSIPKGEAEPHELGSEPATVTAAKARNRAAGVDLLAVARREARAETGLAPEGPFRPLGGIKAHHHRLVYAWAAECDGDAVAIGGGAEGRAGWFDLVTARRAIVPAQRRFIDDLEVVAWT